MKKKRSLLRKLLWFLLSVIVIACVALWSYVQYQRHISYRTLIHDEADAVIRVDVYSIYKSMLADYFTSKKSTRKQVIKGVAIPANIFCYSIKSKQPTTWFVSFPIEDLSSFRQSFLKESFFSPEPGAGTGQTVFYTNPDKKITAIFDDSRLVLAYSFNREDVKDILLDILQKKNMRAVSESPFRDIKALDGHLTFLSAIGKGSLDFNKGNIQASMTLPGKMIRPPAVTSHRQPDEDEAVNLWLYTGLKPLLEGRKNLSALGITLDGDSLLACNPEGIELSVTRPALQRDSVVTYEYNDDFEKVPTTTIQEHKVPGIYLRVKANPQPLYHYLQSVRLISADSGTVDKAVFPLYQLYALPTQEYVQLSTLKAEAPQQGKVSGPDFFGLYINFDKLLQQQEFVLIHNYIRPYQQLEAKAYKNGAQDITLEATLFLKDRQRQALLQLLDNFQGK